MWSKKPREQTNMGMEELPTFTKWLQPFVHSDGSNTKSKRAYRLFQKTPPLLVLDSTEKAGVVVSGDVPKEDGVVPVPGGCCCWQTSKFARRRRPVANAPPDKASDLPEVAAGGCCCCSCAGGGCLPKFQICGRKRKERPNEVPNLGEEESGCRHSKFVPTFHICGRTKVAADDSDLCKEEKVATVTPDLHKEGSGCCCAATFRICGRRRRRRKVVVGDVDVSNVSEKKKVDAGVVNMQDGVSEEGGFKSAERVGCLQALNICAGRKRVTGDPDPAAASSDSKLHKEEVVAAVDPDLGKEGSGCCYFRCMPKFQICGCGRRNVASTCAGRKRVTGDPDPAAAPSDSKLHKEEVVAVVDPDLRKEGSGCCYFRCMPKFQICGRRNAARVVGVSDLPEEVASSSVVKSARGSCWPWLPKFLLCDGRMAVDASIHQEEEQNPPAAVQKESGVSDLLKEDKVSTGGVPDHQKEEGSVASGVSDLGGEESGCCSCFKSAGKAGDRRRRRRSRSSRSREGCWQFHICRGREKVSVSVPNLREEEGLVVNGVSDVHNEGVAVAGATGVVATTDRCKSTRGCGCCQSKLRRRTVATGEDDGVDRRSKSKRRTGWLRR